MTSFPFVIHFMRRGQAFYLRPFFPSAASCNEAQLWSYPDETLQKMRQQQEQRILARQLETFQGEAKPGSFYTE